MTIGLIDMCLQNNESYQDLNESYQDLKRHNQAKII